jgi:hypothetical protein
MNLSLDAFLSDVEKRLKAATQGPWAVVSDSLHYAIAAGDNVPIGSYLRVVETNEWQQNGPRHSNAGGIERERDAEFIAHSPQDVAGLVAVVRAIPTREQVAQAIHEASDAHGGKPEQCLGPLPHQYLLADAAMKTIRAAMESAVHGSESQNDDEAGKCTQSVSLSFRDPVIYGDVPYKPCGRKMPCPYHEAGSGPRSSPSKETAAPETVREVPSLTSKAAAGLDGGTP